MSLDFRIDKKIKGHLGRAGVIRTKNGEIKTPSFVVVGTKATVKAVPVEILKQMGVQVVLANTYHLFLQPGDELIKQAGGFGPFMNWNGPTMTDSGGFQVFSLGAAFGGNVSKVAKGDKDAVQQVKNSKKNKLCQIDDEGVNFKSHIDGKIHRLTPERSMEIQYNLGADMIFAFDECTSPLESFSYQNMALDRTYKWAKRCIKRHEELDIENKQALFGVVQGGKFEELRRKSAKGLADLSFDGFGIGGSFSKDDLGTAVKWVNEELPVEKPRHLLGIGEPLDLFLAVENGCDLFDCVTPTRHARHGLIYTKNGPINLMNSKYKNDFSPLDVYTDSPVSLGYSKAYLSHLYRSREILSATIASIHNIYFLINLVNKIRQSILEDNFFEFKEEFIRDYYKNKNLTS